MQSLFKTVVLPGNGIFVPVVPADPRRRRVLLTIAGVVFVTSDPVEINFVGDIPAEAFQAAPRTVLKLQAHQPLFAAVAKGGGVGNFISLAISEEID